MCGIVGFSKFERSLSIDSNRLLDTLVHRGPDDQNFYETDDIYLGHTRLSIVGIADGRQPMHFDELTLIFNGEIYNYKEIKKDLINQGYSFDTASDTEVLLKAFHFWGKDFISKLNGMYAFVIFCNKTKKIFLARDFFGIKPLYFCIRGTDILFSSEIMSLVSIFNSNNIDFNLSSAAQKDYLKNGASNIPIIKDINELEKGKLFCLENGELTEINSCSGTTKIDSADNLQNLLEKELDEQLNADVEVGIMLSGGIDSSLLTALSSKKLKNLKTFSIAFEEGKKFDESKYSRKVANRFSTEHHEFKCTEDVMLSYLPKLIEALDTPICDPAMLPALYLSDKISTKVKVVLSGDGGDELFAGYTHHIVAHHKSLLNFAYNLIKFIPVFNEKKEILRKLLENNTSLENQIDIDLNEGLNFKLLRKTDLCSMRFGIEVRVPYLSKRIFSYSKSKNISSFIGLTKGKLPLRKLTEKLIDKEIAYKEKKGFRIPLKKWIVEGSLGSIVEQDLNNHLLISEDVITKSEINKVLANLDTFYQEAFSIYLLNNWIKKAKNI